MNQNYSYTLAERLKELRRNRSLSHEKLRRALAEKYDIEISIDSLKNYEVTEEHHSKATKNLGMRVEYLRCLADFYGVSSDYLLGISDTKSSATSFQEMVDSTGLSEHTITALIKLQIEQFLILAEAFNAHEICKKIEESISYDVNKFRETDFEVTKANLMEEFSSEE